MPALSKYEATEMLARVVERTESSHLPEIYSELFPEGTSAMTPAASEIAKHIRDGIEAEEIVDLWNVVFPEDRNVWYDEEANFFRFNEEAVGYAD